MTCKQMGGPCDAPMSAASEDEMMKVGMEHLETAHPEMAADVKAAPKDDPKMVEWSEKFKKDWEETPDDAM